jgi:hypothetical protein
VAEALKVLEWAGVLTWQNRIARVLVRERDLFGRWASRWRVIRTSNAYVFRDPQPRLAGVPASKSENRIGTPDQEIPRYLRPVLRPRIEAQSIANMEREAAANRDRQLLALMRVKAAEWQEGSGNEQAAGGSCAQRDGAGEAGAGGQRGAMGSATGYDQAAVPEV